MDRWRREGEKHGSVVPLTYAFTDWFLCVSYLGMDLTHSLGGTTL